MNVNCSITRHKNENPRNPLLQIRISEALMLSFGSNGKFNSIETLEVSVCSVIWLNCIIQLLSITKETFYPLLVGNYFFRTTILVFLLFCPTVVLITFGVIARADKRYASSVYLSGNCQKALPRVPHRWWWIATAAVTGGGEEAAEGVSSGRGLIVRS